MNALPRVLGGVERCLQDFIAGLPQGLGEGMYYALFPAGKRLRPAVMMRLGQALGVPVDKLLAGAAAVEMIHGYSLVHDDLPELDGDLLRRGRPSVHVAFGHAQALLIGDALHSGAFQVLGQDAALQDHERCAVVHELATAALGMVAGQYQELSLSARFSEENLLEIYRGKTGALFGACWAIPAILADVAELVEPCRRHGVGFGVAFQLLDDLQDLHDDRQKGMCSHPIAHGEEATRALLHDVLQEISQFLADHELPGVLDDLLGLIV